MQVENIIGFKRGVGFQLGPPIAFLRSGRTAASDALSDRYSLLELVIRTDSAQPLHRQGPNSLALTRRFASGAINPSDINYSMPSVPFEKPGPDMPLTDSAIQNRTVHPEWHQRGLCWRLPSAVLGQDILMVFAQEPRVTPNLRNYR